MSAFGTDRSLIVVLKPNSSLSFRMVFGSPLGICLNSFKCLTPRSMLSSKSGLTSRYILPFCHADVSSKSILRAFFGLWLWEAVECLVGVIKGYLFLILYCLILSLSILYLLSQQFRFFFFLSDLVITWREELQLLLMYAWLFLFCSFLMSWNLYLGLLLFALLS